MDAAALKGSCAHTCRHQDFRREGVRSPFQAARYHSLVISRDDFPDEELEVTAWTEDETIMAVRHRRYPKIQGVQFHPESIITENGLTIVRNWVALINA